MTRGFEMRLETPLGRFAGLAWKNPGAPRVICLHGWLDNAASYVPLAPYLEDFDVMALDFAGHGHSRHRLADTRYYMVDNLWDLDAVLDELGWADCHLIGHSLGGGVACTYAAASPERVRRLVTLDGLGPLTAPPSQTARRLKRSLKSVRGASGRLREFASVEDAARARQSVSDLSREAARTLCERALKRQDGHFRWCTDPALNWHSPVLLTEKQVLNVLAAIESPTLAIYATDPARWMNAELVARRAAAIADCRSHQVAGHHHFHMEQPAEIAPLIVEFLSREETAHGNRQD